MKERARLGVIAAGGLSTRMGRAKAEVQVGDRRMIDALVEAMLGLVDEIVIAGPSDFGTGLLALPDPPDPIAGPLVGLASVIDGVADEGNALLVAVDQPLVRTVTLSALLELADGESAVVPIDGFRQVTCAVYPAVHRDTIRHEAVVNRGSLQTLLERIPFTDVTSEEWERWGEDGRSWFSVDSPGDVETAERWRSTGFKD